MSNAGDEGAEFGVPGIGMLSGGYEMDIIDFRVEAFDEIEDHALNSAHVEVSHSDD